MTVYVYMYVYRCTHYIFCWIIFGSEACIIMHISHFLGDANDSLDEFYPK